MARVVLSDATVAQKCDFYRGLLQNSPTYLRLFQNNFVPDPSNLLSDFVEATFLGYAAVDISPTQGAKSQIQPGEYHWFSGVYTYAAPSGGPPQTIYGCYIEVHVPTVRLFGSARFDSPVIMQVSGLPFSLQLEFIDWAASILNAP